jgi:transcriptional regulator with AAA-type ATPase domain
MVYDAVTRQSGPTLPLEPFKKAMHRDTPLEPSEANRAVIAFPEQLPTLEQASELLLDEAMKRAGANQSIAADMLGISHQAISKRLQKRKLPPASDAADL